MKKEGASAVQEIEKMYGLDKYEKTEYVKQISKEFLKYGKKLQKISKYEELQRQGQPINKEMSDLLAKKDQFVKHLESLKVALDIYAKSLKKAEGPAEPEKPEAPKKDVKAEIEEKVKEFCFTSAKRLGYFFAIAATLVDKDKAEPNPLVHLTPDQRSDLCKAYKAIVHVPEEKDTTLAEEASRSADLIGHFLHKEGAVGVATIIDQIMGDNALVNTHFRLVAPKPQPEKEYSVSQTISVGKDIVQEQPKKEVPVPAPVQPAVQEPAPAKEEPKLKEAAEALKTKEVTEVPKPEEKSSWAEELGEEEEEKPSEPHEHYAPEKEEPKEAEFEVATSKGEERKKRMEERSKMGERGRYSGRRRGGRYRGHEEGARGEYQGRSRPRGMRRAEGRAPRGTAQ